MTETCSNCKGKGYKIPCNGVDPNEQEEAPCMVCKTTGKVESEPTKKIFIVKYHGVWAG